MLKYIGNGSAVPGIPPRDLDDAEIEKYIKPKLKEWGITMAAFLESPGIYKEIKTKKKAGE
jgi:hypothetical protein